MNVTPVNSSPLATALLLGAVCSAACQPTITVQPKDQTNYVGATATFIAAVTGTAPVFCQWQKFAGDYLDLPGATNSTLTLTNVQTSNEANYRIVVTDTSGTTNSVTVHLYVLMPERLFISNSVPGFVTLSWHGNMVLLEALASDKASLDSAFWFRAADTSPAILPVRSGARFFRLAALPPVAELGAAAETSLDGCRRLYDCKACETFVAIFFLTGPTGALPNNPEVGEASLIGIELGSTRLLYSADVLSRLSNGIQPEP